MVPTLREKKSPALTLLLKSVALLLLLLLLLLLICLVGSGLAERAGSLWRDTAAADGVGFSATTFMSTSFKPEDEEGRGSLVGEEGALWVSV